MQNNKSAMHPMTLTSSTHKYNEDYWTSSTLEDSSNSTSEPTTPTTPTSSHFRPAGTKACHIHQATQKATRIVEPFIVGGSDSEDSDIEMEPADQQRKKALPVRHKQKPAGVGSCPLPPAAAPNSSLPAPTSMQRSSASYPGGANIGGSFGNRRGAMAVYSHFGPNGSKGPRTAGAAQQAWRQEVDGIGSSLPLRPGTVANDGGSSTSDLPGRPASEDSAMGADERGTEASRSENARPAAGRQARSKRRGGINAYYSNVSNTPDAAA